MKVKKLAILILMFAITIFLSASNFAQVNANNINDNALTISPLYLQNAEFSLDLSDISFFDINNDLIVFTTSTSNQITLLDRKNKNISHIDIDNIDVDDSVTYLKLTSNYLFVGASIVGANNLLVFDLKTKTPIKLKDQDDQIFLINDYNFISIVDAEYNGKQCVLIATTLPNSFSYHYFLASGLEFLVSDTVENDVFLGHDLSYFSLTSSSYAYIVGNTNRLFKVKLSPTFEVQAPTRFYPDNDFVSMITVQKELGVDYLVAVSKEQRTVKVTKTTTPTTAPSDDKETTWSKGPEPLENNSFKKGTINRPTDVSFFNNQIYISDSGTKSIQSFSLEIDNDDNMKLNGEKIIVASFAAEVGRFNPLSHITTKGDNIVVADTANNRLQIINNEKSTEILNEKGSRPQNIAVNTNGDIFYSVKKTDTTSALIKLNTSTATFNEDAYYTSNDGDKIMPVIASITMSNNATYILAGGSLLHLPHSSSNSPKELDTSISHLINEQSIIGYSTTTNALVVYASDQLHLLNTAGELISSLSNLPNIVDIAVSGSDVFILHDDKISKYSIINDTFEYNQTIQNSKFSNYTQIVTNNNSGTIYAFNNQTCGLESVSLPLFNFLQSSAIVRTTTHNVAIYARASGLNGDKDIEIITSLPINTYITLYSKHPVYKNGNYFFVVNLDGGVDNTNGGFGYVNIADVFFDNEHIVKDLHNHNAKINILDHSEHATIYSTDTLDSTVICNLPNTHRIFVGQYDQSTPFTYIRFYDENQQEVYGYVLTKYVQLNKISQSQVTSLIILAAAFVMIIILLFVFLKFKKTKNFT